MKKIEFFFDFLSPFSYFAWVNHREEIDLDVVFDYKPVLMGKLFSHFEFRGPGEIQVKRDYELKKCFRYAHNNKIAFHPPQSFPFNPLAIIRCATKYAAKENQIKTIDTLFKAVWAKGQILEDPERLQNIFLNENLSSDIIERSFEREAKTELKQNIKEAIDKNIFGVPTFAVDEEYFWGNDSIETLKRYLEGHDNWDRELYNKLVRE